MPEPKREQIIRAAWDERGSKLWDRSLHSIAGLHIPALKRGSKADILEFKLELARVDDEIIDTIICEGVVVAVLTDRASKA